MKKSNKIKNSNIEKNNYLIYFSIVIIRVLLLIVLIRNQLLYSSLSNVLILILYIVVFLHIVFVIFNAKKSNFSKVLWVAMISSWVFTYLTLLGLIPDNGIISINSIPFVFITLYLYFGWGIYLTILHALVIYNIIKSKS